MSEDSSQPQPSEEVDLGQLFKLIGNGFRNFFNFIGNILNKLFLAFVWLVFFAKKHFIIIAISAIVGVVWAVLQQKIGDPIYKSTVVINQNYDTGRHLYYTVDYYNSLIEEEDSTALGDLLGIESTMASKIISFEVESLLSENDKLELFDFYIENIDSTLAQTISFNEFIKNANDSEHKLQKITLKSESKDKFKFILMNLIDNVTSNEFFKNEQRKDSLQLSRREIAINESLTKSDTLQRVYQEVLKTSAEKVAGGATSITFEGADNQSNTKEFELYNKDIELRSELVSIKRQKEDIENIIDIVSMQQDKGTLVIKGKLFGFETNKLISYGIKLTLLMFVILLLIEFVIFLERYKDKV